ncbi:hypothetical protein A3F66_02570 [candidate division TM6 bacterium RIFCSPHIGHO2_12_FULL_32_22]|nr:MAG: hypothetical protein A3F66_02570 [candidate division TM6 bacterium RIFCSPHIGHO2_12_FULL_32_22]
MNLKQNLQKLNNYKNKNILVTGGAGFIGSHIVDLLYKFGANIRILDNLSAGKLENLTNSKFEFIEGDISNFETCLKATKNIDFLFHLAALVSVEESIIDPLKCNQINVTGTLNLLEASKINHVKKFIFSSSAAVYGASNDILDEKSICNPISPYGLSKLIGEQYTKLFSKHFQTISLRYFNVFGQRQDPSSHYSGVVAKFRRCIEENLDITIFGDGNQTRDFIDVTLVAQANLALALTDINNESFNVATGKSISLLQLVENLKKDFPNYKREIQFKPARNGDIKFSYACTKKLNSILEI